MAATAAKSFVPGKPDDSLFIIAIRHTDDDLKMPKKEKLSDRVRSPTSPSGSQMGAPDPRAVEKRALQSRVVEIDYEEGRKFWSFQPSPSEARRLRTVKNGKPGRAPTSTASSACHPRGRETRTGRPTPTGAALVRRLYFDLLGLPPTPEQADAVYRGRLPGRPPQKLVDRTPRFPALR